MFLATEDGKVRKMIRFPQTNISCLIEEIKIVENGHPRPVKNMKISENHVSAHVLVIYLTSS